MTLVGTGLPIRLMAQNHREIPKEHRASEHLANERTFLAWVRTSVALISLGFVLARVLPRAGTGGHRFVESLPLGIGMIAFGALLTVLAAWRYHVVNRAIEAGLVRADRGLVWLVTLLVAVLAAALIAFM
jgi:putative membrane protein